MRYALKQPNDNIQNRVLPEKGATGYCSCCKSAVIAKCGDIVVDHWAHKSTKDCDTWQEGMTDWHIEWQEEFPEHNREIFISPHRADVRTDGGVIIEFQHSPINNQTIKDREAFYGPMCWVFDGTEMYMIVRRTNGNTYYLDWKQGRQKSIFVSDKPKCFDNVNVLNGKNWERWFLKVYYVGHNPYGDLKYQTNYITVKAEVWNRKDFVQHMLDATTENYIYPTSAVIKPKRDLCICERVYHDEHPEYECCHDIDGNFWNIEIANYLGYNTLQNPSERFDIHEDDCYGCPICNEKKPVKIDMEDLDEHD